MERNRVGVRAGALALVTALALSGCVDEGDGDGNGNEEATQGDQWCSDVSIAAFPGGAEGTPFTNNVHNGYRAAAEDLGPDVQYFFSDWDTQRMIAQFSEAMAQQPDAIVVMGHPGDEAFDPLIDEAYAAGIQVTVVNVELPEALAAHQGEGLGYVGAPQGRDLSARSDQASGIHACRG